MGDQIEIYDYQIVNGCQTSYVLFDNRDILRDDSFVMVKLIEVTNEDVSDRVIYTTNRQTEVKSEAFVATKHFHKRLQDYYDAVSNPYRLYYERRSKQYDLNDGISKNRVITLTQQIQSYLAMFLNEPHSTHAIMANCFVRMIIGYSLIQMIMNHISVQRILAIMLMHRFEIMLWIENIRNLSST